MKFHLLCTFFSTIENKPSVTKMSDLLIIYVTGLCLQARTNIVSNKGEKKGLLNISLLPQVSTPPPTLKYSLNLCKWHCHPLKNANAALVLHYEVSALQKVPISILLAVWIAVGSWFAARCVKILDICPCLLNISGFSLYHQCKEENIVD